jgi:membrane protein required for beta-lactamase induction
MPPVPNYDLGILITIDICLALAGLLTSAIFTWFLARQNFRSQEMLVEVTRISQRIDARLRRDFPNIGGELGD